jgi:Ca-activated chloride channel homolog
MTDRDLHSLKDMATPAPRMEAKVRAMTIGMASFDAAQKEWDEPSSETILSTSQGIGEPERPTNVTSLKKERSWMRRYSKINPRAYAPIAASIIAMVAAAPFLLRSIDVRPPVSTPQTTQAMLNAKGESDARVGRDGVGRDQAPAPGAPTRVAPVSEQSAWVKLCQPANGKTACLVHHEKIDGNTGMVSVSVDVWQLDGTDQHQLVVRVPAGMSRVRAAVYTNEQWASAQRNETVNETLLKPVDLEFTHWTNAVYTAVGIAPRELIEAMKSGGRLMITTSNAAQLPIVYPVPLNGFAVALAGPPMDAVAYAQLRAPLMTQGAAQQEEMYKEYLLKQQADADAKAKPQVLAGVVSEGRSGCGNAPTGSPTCAMEQPAELAKTQAEAARKKAADQNARKQMAEAKMAAEVTRRLQELDVRRQAGDTINGAKVADLLNKSPKVAAAAAGAPNGPPPTASAPTAQTARPGEPQIALAQPNHVGADGNQYIVSNNSSRSRFGFRGDARIAGSDVSGWGGHELITRAQQESRDKFDAPPPNATKSTLTEPVSTFSVDVDTASYALARRHLAGGRLPPAASVRVEEMINYFKYDYRRPESASAPFEPQITVTANPWNPNTKLVHIGLKGYEIKAAERPRANIVLLVDVSGSMGPADRLPMLKTAFGQMLSELRPDDTVAIVTYASGTAVALPPTRVADAGIIRNAIDRLHAGGGTYGAGGLQLAYELAAANFDAKGVNRIILGTDGDWNIGISDKDQLKTFIEAKRKSGIYLSILGVGMGNHNDALMQTLAQNGNGVAAYIDTLSEARKVLVDEISSSLFTIAKDVKIQVEFNPAQVAEYRLVGYETRALKREDFANDKVDAGDVGSGHAVTAIYEITPVGSPAVALPELRYGPAKQVEPARVEPVARTAKDGEYGFFKLRYKLPNEEQSRLLELPISKALEKGELGVASDDVRFSIAVAAYGQLLRGHANLGMTFDDVIALANASRGPDPFGLRAEFVNLARAAKAAR